MAKRPRTWDDQVDLVSSDDEGDMEQNGGPAALQQIAGADFIQPDDTKSAEDSIAMRAKIYQEYIQDVPIPKHRGSVIPCNSWLELAKSMKILHKQPLHYLTNSLLKQWDKARFETGEDYQPLDTVIHPVKAEATIWLIEEVHRLTASSHHLSKLWIQDPMYHAFIDPYPEIWK